MTLPNLTLTATARAELQRLMGLIRDFRPLACVVWSTGGVATRPDGRSEPLPAGWGVGFHDAAKIPPEFVVEIDGVEFALEPDHRLDGQTLDFDGKRFRVVGNAV